MSFFTNIVRYVKESYSEINAATLTGAIDVIVVEQEDGTFKSSPFHVRFGKLGVLKAKEKIVDLEVNGEPVLIQMKLDDTGAAFFVEDVAISDYTWNVELATSPIPDQGSGSQFVWPDKKIGALKPTRLFDENNENTHEDVTKKVPSSLEESANSFDSVKKIVELESRKGKLNKRKRRRRNQMRHSRRGSRTSLKEILLQAEPIVESTDDLFDMDDLNDADQEDEIGGSEPESSFFPTPKNHNLDIISLMKIERTHSTTSELFIENSLIGSRVLQIPNSTSEAEALETIFVESRPEQCRPKSVSPGFHYFSDGESGSRGGHSTLDPPSVQVDRPSTPGILSDSELDNQKSSEDQNVWRWGELPNTSPCPVIQIKEEQEAKKESEENTQETEKRSWFGGWSNKTEVKDELGGVYLDDIVDNPDLQAIYLKPIKTEPVDPLDISDIPKPDLVNNTIDLSDIPRGVDDPRDIPPREDDCESGHGPSLPMSPCSLIGIPGSVQYDSDCEAELNRNCETDLPTLISRHLPDLAASLCGGLTDASITPEQFEAHFLTYPQFLEMLTSGGASLVNDSNLVIRVHEKYLSWEKAAPILLSVMLFKQSLPSEVISEITKDEQNVNISISAENATYKEENDGTGRKTSSWFGWFGSGPRVEDIKKEATDFSTRTEVKENSTVLTTCIETKNNSTSSEDSDAACGSKRFRKTLRLSTKRLAGLKLNPGRNEVEFSVTTAFQGTTRCKCHIYLWHHTDKVVISDIDGTITKSDVLGHILPVIGRDWAQSGVAQLFTKINSNSYKIMYLSARAIGQASITKDYLQSVKQGDVCLPDGPIFLNPDSLIHAFRREVIDRNPEEFKIRCLKDIQSLFEQKNPFFAGYGNRPNDAYAYRAVGIPVSRIFTINPAGELRHELTQNFQTSYTEQDSIVDLVFPPVGKDGFDPDFEIQEFSSYGYWREVFLEIDPEILEEFLGKEGVYK